MKYNLIKKSLVITLIFLLIGVNILQSISGNTLKFDNLDNKSMEKNGKNINFYNTQDYANEPFIKEDSVYLITDEFGVYEYSYKNFDSNYKNSDNPQFLNYRKIEQTSRVISPKKLDNNFVIKNKEIPKESNSLNFNKKLKSSIAFFGNIFYVGGSGPSNYTRIQDAIDDASPGDTIFVYNDSSPYYENIIIDKSIQLIGEDRDSTIINGSKLNSSLDTINITADNVYINGFSINDNFGYYYQAAVLIVGDYAILSNCKIHDNDWIGISMIGSSHSQIFDCELYNNLMAIYLIDSNENEIRDCLCYKNSEDILLFQNANNNQIINCTCIGNDFSGIHVQHSSGNHILNCKIFNGYEGIGLAYAPNTIMEGNVLNNNNENFGIGSSSLSDFYCDIDTSNIINGKPIYYWINHNNEQVPSDAGFIALISCKNILVKDLEINNNFQGIVCAGSSNCTIDNCSFLNNGGHGSFFISSPNNTIRNCSCRNNFFSGIYLNSLSNRNIISNNTLSNIQVCGIWVEESTNNYLTNHVISNCLKGISLDNSNNNVLRDNDMVNCGLFVDGTSLSDYFNDVDTSNKVNGKTLYYYVEKNGLIVPNDAGEVILVNCEYCNVSNLDCSEGTIGVELAYSCYNNILGNILNGNNLVAIDLDCSSNNHNIIKGNSINDNNYGIDVDLSNNNIIQDNTLNNNGVGFSLDSSNGNIVKENSIQNSWNGIYLSDSINNNIYHNIINDCGFNGIYLLYSKGNIVKDNEMVNCGLLVYGITLSEYINDVDTSNKVNGKTLYYYVEKDGLIVPNDAGEVILVNCEYCNVSNLDCSEGTIGIELAYSNYNIISKNTLNNNNFAGLYIESSNFNTVKINKIQNNSYGITLQLANSNNIKNNKISINTYGCYLYLSNSNIFSGNNILYNTYGILFNFPSNGNNIHHNNLIDNGYNAWDENKKTNIWDYGNKGNYWGDYTKRYPNAKKIWLKAIWDTPYDIPIQDNQDRYPLIRPFISPKEKTINLLFMLRRANY